MSSQSIFWHDYETWGVNPQKDFPCQFAGIRTDLDLNPIEKPVTFYCQIPNDYLPHPQAALVTGITPQHSLRDGLVEAQFIDKINQHFSQPQTCVAGYNSLRFDDEVTRYSLYRNFHDPYAREWQNGNSRWDIIDLVRACYALRPQGIEWAFDQQGAPSFKLENLSAANGIEHLDAHDALSDVYATIGLAKKIKQAQPKLYDYVFEHRKKQQIKTLIDIDNLVPLVHISSKLPASQGCCTWILPIAWHPRNANAVICLNLAMDPQALFELDSNQLLEKLYQPSNMLEEGEQRLPIKLIHINKCPILAPAKVLTEENAQRLGIDRQQCLLNLASIKSHTHLAAKLTDMFNQEKEADDLDPDFALYSGGFFSDSDRQKMQRVNKVDPSDLAAIDWQFDDPRLNTMLFRFRGRNYTHTLDANELQKWQRHREYRFLDSSSPASIHLSEFMQQIEQLMMQHHQSPKKLAILRDLANYAENL